MKTCRLQERSHTYTQPYIYISVSIYKSYQPSIILIQVDNIQLYLSEGTIGTWEGALVTGKLKIKVEQARCKMQR